MSRIETFVLITSEGKYVVPCRSSGFANEHDTYSETTSLNSAYVFKPTERREKPYKKAIENGCQEILAIEQRRVLLGNKEWS